MQRELISFNGTGRDRVPAALLSGAPRLVTFDTNIVPHYSGPHKLRNLYSRIQKLGYTVKPTTEFSVRRGGLSGRSRPAVNFQLYDWDKTFKASRPGLSDSSYNNHLNSAVPTNI